MVFVPFWYKTIDYTELLSFNPNKNACQRMHLKRPKVFLNDLP
jgi:hypothetical protein